MAASASTTITFAVAGTEGTDGDIAVELDDELNGDKTTFRSGDTVYFLVHTKPVTLDVDVDTTLGSVSENGSKSVPVEDTIQFVKSKTGTLDRIPNGPVTATWIGRAGGTPTFSGDQVTLSAEVNAAILKCTYNTTAKSYKLTGVTIPTGMDEIQVLVVVTPASA